MSKVVYRVLSGTLPSILLCLVMLSAAGAAEPLSAFGQSGIHFPGGFDLNTVGTVTGRVISLDRPDSSGPVIVNIQSAWEKYAVVTCPPWYWDNLKINLSMDDDIKVTGSKSLGKNGTLYIIAQDITLSAQGGTVSLRDKAGNPLWGGQNGVQGTHHGKSSQKNEMRTNRLR